MKGGSSAIPPVFTHSYIRTSLQFIVVVVVVVVVVVDDLPVSPLAHRYLYYSILPLETLTPGTDTHPVASLTAPQALPWLLGEPRG